MVDFMTHQALVYQASCRGCFRYEYRRVFLNDLCLHVYVYPGLRRALREEDWSEFLLGFLNKLPDILMNYEFRGPSFLGYVNRLLDWHLKSYYRKCERSRHACWVCERESLISYGGCEMSCTVRSLGEKMESLLTGSDMTRQRQEAFRQRLLILVLKNTAALKEDDYLSAFPLLGPEQEEALQMREHLLKSLEPRFRRREELSRTRNKNYYLLALTAKKKDEAVSPGLRCRLDEKIELYRRRLRKLDDRIRRIPMVPCNEEIAALMGMPKGSVDSGLYYLRQYLGSLEKRELSCLEGMSSSFKRGE